MRPILSGILLLFLSLGTIMVPGALAQQTPDIAQARIWQRALQWIYEDNNNTVGKNTQKPVPKVSSESVEQFEKDLSAASKAKQDEYNFYTRLYQPVQSRLSKKLPVSNEALIDAIVAEAAKKSDRNSKSLRLALESTISGNTAIAPENSLREIPETTLAADKHLTTQKPESSSAPVVNSSKTETVKVDSNMSLYLSILALILAVFALLRSNRKSSSSRSATPARTSEGYANAQGAPIQANQGNQNINALKKKIESLEKGINNLKKENDTWRADLQQAIRNLQTSAFTATVEPQNYAPASFNIAPQAYQEPTPEYISSKDNFTSETDHLLAEEVKPENLVKYTRVPEDGQLKDRELHYDSSDTWSFMEVTLPENGGNTAKFRINPHVNHALAINNSLDRLENAFEFTRSANKATHILNDTDGELMRTAQGWQITKRAKIHLA